MRRLAWLPFAPNQRFGHLLYVLRHCDMSPFVWILEPGGLFSVTFFILFFLTCFSSSTLSSKSDIVMVSRDSKKSIHVVTLTIPYVFIFSLITILVPSLQVMMWKSEHVINSYVRVQDQAGMLNVITPETWKCIGKTNNLKISHHRPPLIKHNSNELIINWIEVICIHIHM